MEATEEEGGHGWGRKGKGFEHDLTSFDNDQDVLAMSNTTLLDLDKDVHMYFDYVIDVTSEILIEGVFDVILISLIIRCD